MPRGSWTKKDERKYEKILDSCKLERRKGKKRSVAACKRIAAATVNRDRKARLGSTKGEMLQGLRGLRGITAGHLKHLERMFRDHRTGKIDDARLQAEVWLAQTSGATRDQVQQIRERLNYYPRSGASRFQGLRGAHKQVWEVEDRRGWDQSGVASQYKNPDPTKAHLFTAPLVALQSWGSNVPEDQVYRAHPERVERRGREFVKLMRYSDPYGTGADWRVITTVPVDQLQFLKGLRGLRGTPGGDDGLFGLRGLRGRTDDEDMWRKAAELWRDYYREHQPMPPAERRAFLAEKRAWLHSQEARDMGEAPPGYGWSYNDEDD